MKLKSISAIILIAAIQLFLLSCGEGEKKTAATEIVQYLPLKVSKTDLTRSEEVKTYDANSLWEYINGDAEIYLIYDFVEVAATYYNDEHHELAVDLYRFADPLHAYGIYSRLRPEDAEILNLGVEGFTSPGMINLTKGSYLIRIFGYDESIETGVLMINLAEDLITKIPGTATKPLEFEYFPEVNKLKNTDDFYSELFLGQKFLTDIFSNDYLLGSDTVTLFLAHDSAGATYLKWLEYAEKIKSKGEAPKDIPYDQGFSFKVTDSYYNDIMAGLKNKKLIGMANYSQKHKEFLIDWLNALP